MANLTKFSAQVKQLDLKHTWTIARGSSTHKQNIFLTLESEGVTGYGEAAPNVRYEETPESTLSFMKAIKPIVETSDLSGFHDLENRVRGVQTGQTAAKAAFDICLLDWFTKTLQVPLYKYLGLDKTNTPITTYSIGIDSPERIRAKVREAEHFPILKIKVGLENDKEVIATVRSVTDKPLRVDANEGWQNREDAVKNITWLEKQGVEFVEQPMPASRLEDIAWVRERVNLPLIADESVKCAGDIPRIAHAFDGINIKLMKAGGLQEALRMIAVARSLGLKIMLGCMIESSVAISAAAALSPLVDFADLDGNLLIVNDPFTGVRVTDGRLILNDSPGIGVQPETN